MAASVWYFLFFFIKRGIKTIKLISKANQVINQVLVEMIKVTEKVKIKKNKMFEGLSKINRIVYKTQ